MKGRSERVDREGGREGVRVRIIGKETREGGKGVVTIMNYR